MSSTRPSTKSNAPTMDNVSHLTTRERLLIAQAVYEYGSNAWPDISRVLTKHPLISRPKGFFSPQECQKIYGHLMGEAGYECSDETHAPHAQLHLKLSQKHYQARVIELRRLLLEEEDQFKVLTRQIDDIREGRWDEAIAKELGIHTETDNTKSEGEMLAEMDTINETFPEQVEQGVPSVSEDEPMDVSEEQIIPMEEQLVSMKEQDEIATSTPQLSVEVHPAIDTPEQESSIYDRVLSPVEGVKTALEEIKLSAVSDENDVQNIVSLTPSETTPTLSREERTQEELKAIEALEELSRLEPIDVVSDSMQDHASSMQVNDVLDQTSAVTLEDYKNAPVTSNDAVKESLERLPSNTGLEPSISMISSASTTLTGKRKIDVVDVASPDPHRERKKIRDESVPTDDETVSGRRRPKSNADLSIPSIKRFQTVITMLHSQISQHRNGNIFHSPIRESEAPDYHEIVKRPMDLKTIKMRIKDGVVTNSDDYQREIYLMFANAMMYNRPKSDIARMTREMLNESEEHIRDFRQTEGFVSRGKR